MKIALLAAGIAAATFSAPAHAGDDPFLGEIALLPFSFCPQGWTEPKGQIIQIRDNMALYSLLGSAYGGDGKASFALPDLSKAIPVATNDPGRQMRYCIALRGRYPIRP